MPRNQLSTFDKELRKIISYNLKKYTQHITQYQLSEMTGIPKSTLSGYFAMRSTPSAGTVQKIADALHLQKSDIDPRFSPLFTKKNILSPSSPSPKPDTANPTILFSVTPQEQQLIETYRNLSPEGKRVIEAALFAFDQTTKS